MDSICRPPPLTPLPGYHEHDSEHASFSHVPDGGPKKGSGKVNDHQGSEEEEGDNASSSRTHSYPPPPDGELVVSGPVSLLDVTSRDLPGDRQGTSAEPTAALLAPTELSGNPASMVYDWEGKEAVCYKLYITENKSLEEIMEFFKVTEDFTPRYVSIFALATACDLTYCVFLPYRRVRSSIKINQWDRFTPFVPWLTRKSNISSI